MRQLINRSGAGTENIILAEKSRVKGMPRKRSRRSPPQKLGRKEKEEAAKATTISHSLVDFFLRLQAM